MSNEDKILTVIIWSVLLVVLVGSIAFGAFVYGDWKCGLPGVKCVKVK